MGITGLNLGDFVENTQDGILVSHEQRLVFVNRSMEEMLGLASGELLGSMLDDIMATDQTEQSKFINQGNGALRTGKYEANFKRKDGSHCPAEITASLGVWQNKPATVFIVRDITVRKLNEAALRDIETQFLQLTNTIHEVFFVRDLNENRIIYVSPAYESIWQRPVSNLYANPLDFVESVHPEDREQILEGARHLNIIERGSSIHQYRIVRPGGEVRWIRSRTFPVMDETGRAYRVAGIAEDITAHKIAEDKLRLSESQLRQIIDLVPHSIFVKDGEGRFLLVNKAKADLYGATVAELTGALQRDVHPREDQTKRMLADDKLVLDSNLPKLIPEEDLIDAAGNHHILQTIKIPFATSEDGQKAVLGVAIDITERKRTEAALQLSEERLRRSLHYANIGTWDWNIQTGALHWSEHVAPLFGYKTGTVETSYAAFLAAIHPDDRRMVEDTVKVCIDTGRDYDIEHRLLWPDGSIHWVHEAGGVVYGADGNAERMMGTVRNITRRKSAERLLMESETKYHAVMENASDAILLGTMDAWIIDANRRAEELFGYTRDELLQLHGTAIHPKEEHPRLAAAFHDLSTKGNSLYEHLVLRKGGSLITAEVAATIIDYQGEKVVMAIFRDTTARKHAEEERLAHTKAQRDTLVREVHHRIKNNLQGVVGLLRQHASKNPELGAPLESAISQVNSMAVVHGLYGRGSSERIVLCEMVREICHSTGGLTGRMIEPHLTVAVENPIRVAGDEAVPLALILNELIFNAVKHQGSDKELIQVYVQDQQDGALVRIVTPGDHLPPDFDFMAGKGLGTGLKLVKSLLPSNGCQLRIANEVAGVVAELQLSPPVLVFHPSS
jgi:PAS domain S-box-containing protein